MIKYPLNLIIVKSYRLIKLYIIFIILDYKFELTLLTKMITIYLTFIFIT